MDAQNTRPVLMSGVRSKYGRCDYKRFDHIASTHMRAGHGSVGKVDIDCRFMFTKSQWGVIGESKSPAGILYLDLDFNQPADCKLESATIMVTLAQDDGGGARVGYRSDWPVQFTYHFGPRCLRGQESLVQTRKVKNRTPELHLGGYGAGGVGVDKEKIVQTTGRWDFSGHIDFTKGCLWYDRLMWELRENSLEWQPTHSNVIHTAFAVQHNATRFYMTVHVSGKLAKLSGKLKKRLKFGAKGDKHQEIVTKIEWTEGYSCHLRLDRIAQDLHEAMALANMGEVPVELPSAVAASYCPVATGQASAPIAVQQGRPDPLVPTHQPNPGPWSGPVTGAGRQPTTADRVSVLSAAPPALPASRAVEHGQTQTPWLGSVAAASGGGELASTGNRDRHRLAVTLEDLSMAAASFSSRTPCPRVTPPLSTIGTTASESSDSATLVGSSAVTAQEEWESASDTVVVGWGKRQGKQVSASKQTSGAWLHVTAVLLHWFGRIGLLLWGLAGTVRLPWRRDAEPSRRRKRNHTRNRPRPVASEDNGVRRSRVRNPAATKPVILPQERRRRLRRQRPVASRDEGKLNMVP